MLRKYFSSLCVLMAFSAECLAVEFYKDSILKVEEDKVYLNTGSIQVAKNGIFINIEGQLISIDHLKKDDQGVYFERKAGGSSCNLCGFPLVFGFCLNPQCPSKG